MRALLGITGAFGASLMGVISLLAGGYLIVDPTVSLAALVIIAVAWLFGSGAIAVIAGLRPPRTKAA